jgi:hypothetical protein
LTPSPARFFHPDLRTGRVRAAERVEAYLQFHNATPIGYASQFQEPRWVNRSAITAIVERVGTE